MSEIAQPRRTRRRPGENRERLLSAAYIEFGTYGYHGASTAGIAARAEVPQPHVYASFKTKLDLLVAVCDRLGDEVAAPSTRSGGTLDARSRLLYQLVAACHDPLLHSALRPVLRSLEAQLGADAFAVLIARGARSLLDASSS